MKISLRFAATVSGLIAFAGMTAAAPMALAGPFPIGSVPLYDTVYYSDATKTSEVGRNYGVCYGGWGQPQWAGASEFTDGQTTSYASQEHVGWCTSDGTVYF